MRCRCFSPVFHKKGFLGVFLFLFDGWPQSTFSTDMEVISEEDELTGTKKSKTPSAEKIVDEGYLFLANLGLIETNVSSDEIAHFWCQFIILTFRDEQETLDALPFIFCHFQTNRYLSKKFQTPALVKKRAGHLKFLSRLKKLEVWSDVCFAWKSKMRPNNDMVAHRPERNYNEKKQGILSIFLVSKRERNFRCPCLWFFRPFSVVISHRPTGFSINVWEHFWRSCKTDITSYL